MTVTIRFDFSTTDALSAALAALPPGEQGAYQLAKTLFDTREFRRCAQLLQRCTSPLAVFLRNYSLYLVSCRMEFFLKEVYSAAEILC